MNKLSFLAIALCVSEIVLAQTSGVSRLQCDGTYNNYISSDLRDIPVQGIYLEVSDKQVKIVGAPGFDTTYAVTRNLEGGVGFQAHSTKAYSGFLNRFSGQLSLSEHNAEGASVSLKVKQTISATCRKATPLF